MYKPATLLALLLLCLHCGSSDGTANDGPTVDAPASDSNPAPSGGDDTGSPPGLGSTPPPAPDASPQPKPKPLDGGTADAPTSAPSITLVGVTSAHDDNQLIKQLDLNPPQGTQSGDLLLAAIYMGNDALSNLPSFTSPAGWTLVDQTNRSSRGSLLVEWHVVGASEPTRYTWTSNTSVYGVGWVAAYRGVKVTDPIDAHVGQVDTNEKTQYSAPSATTATPNALVVASFAGWTSDMGPHVWTCPPMMTLLANPNDGRERSGCGAGTMQAAPGATPTLTATVSQKQQYAITHVLALKPAP